MYSFLWLRCVLKMDHHCGLLATCVGHRNHTKFIIVLVAGLTLCLQCILLNSCFLNKLVNKVSQSQFNIIWQACFVDSWQSKNVIPLSHLSARLEALIFFMFQVFLTYKCLLPISVYTRHFVILGIACSTFTTFGASVLLFYQVSKSNISMEFAELLYTAGQRTVPKSSSSSFLF